MALGLIRQTIPPGKGMECYGECHGLSLRNTRDLESSELARLGMRPRIVKY